MNCPVCERTSLTTSTLEEGLPCLSCEKCGGSWLEFDSYSRWRDTEQGRAASNESGNNQAEPASLSLVSGELTKLKFCPKCAYILIKYKVGHDVNFSLDRCGHCGGAWFDANEWKILKSQQLHARVYEIFSHGWQSDVREKEHNKAMEDILRGRLGDADYDEFKRVKKWLDTHPKSDELYGLLYGSRMTRTGSRVR
jgi:Zn-finger nucleic acid-binding protein